MKEWEEGRGITGSGLGYEEKNRNGGRVERCGCICLGDGDTKDRKRGGEDRTWHQAWSLARALCLYIRACIHT